MRKKDKLVYGVGINDADYATRQNVRVDGKYKQVWICPYYDRWKSMLGRCYSRKFQEQNPTYKGCVVCEEWHTFSKFKEWMETQDWEGKELDKDFIKDRNKVYSPETCAFVHSEVNSFITDCGKVRGDYMIGVYVAKGRSKFISRCSNPFTSKLEYLGTFDTELEAHLTWKRHKHSLACQLADSEYVTDERVAEALRNRYKDVDQPITS